MASKLDVIELPLSTVRTAAVSGIAACFLATGLLIGYLARGTQIAASSAQAGAALPATPVSSTTPVRGHVPSLEEMKQMADKQASPLLEKLKSNPNDTELLVRVGAIYHGSHQFKEAAAYYGRAAEIAPKDVVLRNKLASSLYREGDVDGAIAQLNDALSVDPTDANSLFNLGTIKLQGKRDPKGALAAWQKLLKTNPQLSTDRRAEVQKLMAQVLTMMGDQTRPQRAEAYGRH